MGQLSRELGCSVAYATPTNKAAAVLRGKLPAGQAEHVRTYHSLLYYTVANYRCRASGRRVQEVPCACGASQRGEDQCGCPRRFLPCSPGASHTCTVRADLKFELRENVGGHRDLIVLDESSMITDARIEEIRSFGVPVLVCGDHGQLPPVKEKMNRYMMRPDVQLSTNYRQTEPNGIVAVALQARETGAVVPGVYGDGSTAVVRYRDNPDVLDCMSPDRFPPGPERVIITSTNAMRSKINLELHGGGRLPRAGDRVVSLENNLTGAERMEQRWGQWIRMENAEPVPVWNGMCGTVRGVNPYGNTNENLVELMIELDRLPGEAAAGACIQALCAVRQFGADQRIRPDQSVRGAALWDYSYAVTAHKAQGSEFRDVVVLDTGAPEWRRWMYTAITRAKERLIVIRWK